MGTVILWGWEMSKWMFLIDVVIEWCQGGLFRTRFWFSTNIFCSYPLIGNLINEKTGFGLFFIGAIGWFELFFFWSRCISSNDIVISPFFSRNTVHLRFKDVDNKITLNAIWVQILVFKRRYKCALSQKLRLLHDRSMLKRWALNFSSIS